jgi:hypothetical protein
MALIPLPHKPVAATAIRQLPRYNDAIEHAIPITTTEIPVTGVADLTLSFVIRLSTRDWYAYTYDRHSGEWDEIYHGTSDGESVGVTCFHGAAEAITDYWTEHAEMGETFDVNSAAGGSGIDSGISVRTDGG